MKNNRKIVLIPLLILALTVFADAQTGWTGEYFFGEDGGETSGGTKIYIAHTLSISEKDGRLNAHLYSQGYQTSRDIYADGKTEGDKLLLHFREKGADHILGEYEKGDLLLTLEQKTKDGKPVILTHWGKFEPVVPANEKSGEIYFEVSEKVSSEWTRIETENREVSIVVPSNFTFFLDEEGFNASKGERSREQVAFRNLRSLTAFRDGVSIWFESYDVRDGEDAYKYFSYNLNGSETIKTYQINGYSLADMTLSNDTHIIRKFYFHSDNKFYILGCGTRNSANAVINTFLQSIKFKDKFLFSVEKEKLLETANPMTFENLDISPFEVTYQEEPKKKQKSNKKKSAENTPNPVEETGQSAIVILTKPRPGYTDLARQMDTKGVIRVRVHFERDGLIREVTVLKGLKHGLTEKALNAVRRMRFLPPERNNVPYSVSKVVVFNFLLY
jgi:TonB family protein